MQYKEDFGQFTYSKIKVSGQISLSSIQCAAMGKFGLQKKRKDRSNTITVSTHITTITHNKSNKRKVFLCRHTNFKLRKKKMNVDCVIIKCSSVLWGSGLILRAAALLHKI